MKKATRVILIIELQLLLLLLIFVVVKMSEIEDSLVASSSLVAEVFKDQQYQALGKTTSQDIIIGNPSAEVSIIMYTKFDCIHCHDFFNETFPQLYSEYIEPGYARFTVRYLFGIKHSHAPLASLAYEANNHNKYLEFNKILNSDEIDANNVSLESIADSLNIQPSDHSEIIRSNFRNALQANISGTPTFIINGNKYGGHKRMQFFKEILDTQASICN